MEHKLSWFYNFLRISAAICDKIMLYILKVPCTILVIVCCKSSIKIVLFAFILDILIGQLAYLLAYTNTFTKFKKLCNKRILHHITTCDNLIFFKLLSFYRDIYTNNNYTKANIPVLIEYVLNKDELSYDYFSFAFYDTPIIAISEGADWGALITQAKLAHEIVHISTHFAFRYYQVKQYLIILIYTAIILSFASINNSLYLCIIIPPFFIIYYLIINSSAVAKREVQADNFALKFIQSQYGVNKMKDIANRFVKSRLAALNKNKIVELSRIKHLLLLLSISQKEELCDYLDDLWKAGIITKYDYNQIAKYMNCDEVNNVTVIGTGNFSWGEILLYTIMLAITTFSIGTVNIDLIFVDNIWRIYLSEIIIFILINIILYALCAKKRTLLNSLQ